MMLATKTNYKGYTARMESKKQKKLKGERRLSDRE